MWTFRVDQIYSMWCRSNFNFMPHRTSWAYFLKSVVEIFFISGLKHHPNRKTVWCPLSKGELICKPVYPGFNEKPQLRWSSAHSKGVHLQLPRHGLYLPTFAFLWVLFPLSCKEECNAGGLTDGHFCFGAGTCKSCVTQSLSHTTMCAYLHFQIVFFNMSFLPQGNSQHGKLGLYYIKLFKRSI